MDVNNSPLNSHAASSMSSYFTWSSSEPFYALSSSYLYLWYWNSVRTWDKWVLGFSPDFHDESKGILPTGIGSTICDKLSNLIFGNGVVFKSLLDKGENENLSLNFISNKFNKKEDLKSKIQEAILKSVQLGNSLLKINSDNSELWVDSIAGNKFFCDLNPRGEITSVKTFSNLFTKSGSTIGNSQENESFGLCEERYYKYVDTMDALGFVSQVKRPFVKYNIYKLTVANVFTANNHQAISFKNLPTSIRSQFLESYGGRSVKIGDEFEEELPFETLGVYLIKHTAFTNFNSNIKMGDSALAKLIPYLMKYDFNHSETLNDLYISRAKVFIPSTMQQVNKGFFNGFDDCMFTKIPNLGADDQLPITLQPNMRIDSFKTLREETCKEIANAIGISVSSLFSDITDNSGNVTATAIEQEDATTVLYINNKRNIILNAINDMITDILKFYELEDSVEISFISGGHNATAMTDNIVKLKSAGIISNYEAISKLNPTYSESQIVEELEESKKEKEEAMPEVLQNPIEENNENEH